MIFPVTVQDISPADARWKQADGAWSILEIVQHLASEEAEDFRMRLRMTLEDPTQERPPIDPEGWAIARKFNEGDLPEAIERFTRERRASVQWLRSLPNPDWNSTRRHPQFGDIPAGHLLAAWAAHDALHLRQIAKRMFQMAERDSGGFGTRYAGEWGP